MNQERFVAPLKSAARVRNRMSLRTAEPPSGGRMFLKVQCTLEIEGEQKPTLVAENIVYVIGRRNAAS